MVLRLGSRSSLLARIQAWQVGREIEEKNPNVKVEYHFRQSLGDINLHDPLWKMPEKGVFTADFQKDLLEGRLDLVVHSWKDLPIEENSFTAVVATLNRQDSRDLLLFKKKSVGNKHLKILTSSPRREYNLKRELPTLLPFPVDEIRMSPIRGNVQTRLEKFQADESAAGFVLAKAALDRLLSCQESEAKDFQNWFRMHFENWKWMLLPLKGNPTAAAQGALAIEACRDHESVLKILKTIHHEEVFNDVEKERRVLKSYGGGCHQKIGASVLRNRFGSILSLRGVTDRGQVLEEWTGDSFETPKESFWSSQILSKKAVRSEMTTGTDFVDAVYVAKAEAFQKSRVSDNTIVAVAGDKTWNQLAKWGQWVNVSAESLGGFETEGYLLLDQLVGRQPIWTKWTFHGAATGLENLDQARWKIDPTYRIQIDEKHLKDQLEAIRQSKYLFWSSPYYFLAFEKLGVDFNDKVHLSGPGMTADFLKSKTGKFPKIVLNQLEGRE